MVNYSDGKINEGVCPLIFPIKQVRIWRYLQLLLFVVIILLIQYKFFTVAFSLIIGIIMFMVIASKQKRVFLWVMLAYLLSYLFYLYGDRFINELPYRVNTLMILNRFLLLLPILFMVYVLKKFNEEINRYWNKPLWHAKISFPFIWNGFHAVSIKAFLSIAISLNILAFFPFILNTKLNLGFSFYIFLFLFSMINGILEEVLWRGILLTRLVDLAGEKAAAFFSAIAFGFSHLVLGYSWSACLGFAIGGFFYAGVTLKSGSIIPAIIWHVIFNLLMILSGVIPYVG